MKVLKATVVWASLLLALSGCAQEEAISYRISGGWPAYGDCVNIYTSPNHTISDVEMTPLDDGSYEVAFKVIPKENLSGHIG